MATEYGMITLEKVSELTGYNLVNGFRDEDTIIYPAAYLESILTLCELWILNEMRYSSPPSELPIPVKMALYDLCRVRILEVLSGDGFARPPEIDSETLKANLRNELLRIRQKTQIKRIVNLNNINFV